MARKTVNKTVLVGSTQEIFVEIDSKIKELGGWSYPIVTTGIANQSRLKQAVRMAMQGKTKEAWGLFNTSFRKHPYPGASDLVGCLNGLHVEVEIKNRATRDSIKPHQVGHAKAILEARGLHLVATSVEQARKEIFPILENIAEQWTLDPTKETGPTLFGDYFKTEGEPVLACAPEQEKHSLHPSSSSNTLPGPKDPF